jgi:endonuclease/exonuclease/phosphatase family metal-dependent hydrolase
MSIRLVLIFGVAIIMQQAGADAPSFTIMSFNIRYGTALDGENAWPERKEHVLETIRNYNPHILGTQECLDFQADYLEDNLEHMRRIGIGRENDASGEMTAIFYREDVLVPVESGNFWLSETPEIPGSVSWDSSMNRIATWVRFMHRASGRTVFYLNTHFDHRGKAARQKSAELLAARIAALPVSMPIIFTGDFNAKAEKSAPWETLIGAGMRDLWLTAAAQEGPATTWCGFKSPEPDKRIDWILARGPVNAQRCITGMDKYNGNYPSDHLPVIAEVTLEK